jgi:aldose 1-epimerase
MPGTWSDILHTRTPLLEVLKMSVLVGASVAALGSTVPVVAQTIDRQPYGKTSDGAVVDAYTLTNSHGMTAQIITYGGIVTSLKVPDRAGTMANVVLGYPQIDGYVTDIAYFGAIIGRYGNRIAEGRFTLNGATYPLPTND